MRNIIAVLLTSAMATLFAAPAWAVEGLDGSITGGLELFSGDFDNAKLNEYRYNRQGPWAGFFSADLRLAPPLAGYRTEFNFNYISPQDIDVRLEETSYGSYAFDVRYQRLGHNFAFDSKTLYHGIGTGHLTVPAAEKAVISAQANGSAALTTTLEGFLRTAPTTDIQLTRDRVGTGIKWTPLAPVTVKANFDYEHREGTRPFGGTFGFGNAVELAEPIEYDTYNVRLDAEYASSIIYADAGYQHSTFNNSIQSLLYDNPFRTVDGTLSTANPAGYTLNTGGGAAAGRDALAPSNSYDNVFLTLAKNLPLNSRLSMNFSYGWWNQDENLLPITSNSNTAFDGVDYTQLSLLPRRTADAEVQTQNYDVRFTTRPLDKLEVNARYCFKQHENNTDTFHLDNYVRTDATLEDETDSEYTSWINRTYEIEATYEVWRRTHVGAAYEYERDTYFNGSSRTESQNAVKVFVDSRMYDWLTTRLTLEHSNRDARYPDYSQDDGEVPWLRKFYAGDRERYATTFLTTLTPKDDLDVSLEYIFALNYYDNSFFGLRDTTEHTAGLDVNYQFAEWLAMGAYYNYEYARNRQESRQWIAGTISDPFVTNTNKGDPSNWFLNSTDNIHTVGMTADIGLIKDRLGLKLDGLYQVVDSEGEFISGVGTALVDNNPYTLFPIKHVDETQLIKAGASLKFAFTKAVSLVFGYRYENWRVGDITRDGLTQVVASTTGAYRGLLNMDTLYKPYEAHTAFASATYKF